MVSNVFINFAGTLLIKLRTILLLPILIRNFDVSIYGAWSQCYFTAQFLSVVLILGFPQALVRYYPEYKKEKRQGELFFQSIFFVVILCIPMIYFLKINSFWLSQILLKSTDFGQLFSTSSKLVVSLALYYLLLHSVRAQNKIKAFTLIQSVTAWVELLCLCVAILFGWDIVRLIDVSAFVYMFSSICMLKYLWADIKEMKVSFRGSLRLLRYGLPLIPAHLSHQFLIRGDRYLVGYFLGASMVGVYSACYIIASSVGSIVGPIINVLMPKLSSMKADGEDLLANEYVKRSIQILLILMLAGFLILMFWRQEVLTFLSTQKVAQIGDYLFVWIFFGTILSSVGIVSMQLIKIGERTNSILYAFLSSAVMNLALNILLLPRFGIIAAGWATIISNFLLFIIFQVLLRKKLNGLWYNYFWLRFLVPLCALCLCTSFINPKDIVSLIFYLLLLSFVFIVSLLLSDIYLPKKYKDWSYSIFNSNILMDLRKKIL
jgi:O-antigen/teichoic acid export membrane protein